MNVAAKAPIILRNAAGEPPLGIGGLAFRDDQGEMFEHDNPRYRSQAARIGVLELDDGSWLAHPPGFRVDGELFETREKALSAAVDAVVEKARKYMDAKDGEGTSWTESFGNAVICWALSLKAKAAQAADSSDGSANIDQPITDPVIAELMAAKRARKSWPAGHTVGMTNPIVNGQVVTLGTCSCGDTFSYAWGCYEKMDAAIEAHWQKFDSQPEKVDGRGEPIGAKAPEAKKPRKRKVKTSAPEGMPAPTPAPLDLDFGGAGEADVAEAGPTAPRTEPAPDTPRDGAGSTSDLKCGACEPAPIGAGCGPSEADRLDWEGLWSVAWGLPVDDVVAADMIARGLIYALDHIRGYNPTRAGEARVNALKPLFDLDATRKKLGVKTWDERRALVASEEPAPISVPAKAEMHSDQPAEISAGSIEVSEPLKTGLAAHGTEAGFVRETELRGGSLALSDDDDLAIEWPSYQTFLEDKIVTAPMRGIEVVREALHPWLRPHCKDLTVWALRLGCAAIFANFGLHKTAMQLEWCRQMYRHAGGTTLNVVPLGVRHGFIKEALQLGMDVRFIRTTAEYHALIAEGVVHFLTNYESIREGKLDPNLFMACSLDEASVLRSFGSKTYQEFLPLFGKVEFKLVATATPSPNRYKELIHYAGFLGVMDTGLALTRWFQRNSEKAGDLTLYPHKADEFWMWVHSWAAFLQRPSELGYSDDGYELPPLKLTWHEVPADHSKAEPERDGQGVMFRNVANSLSEAATARRDSLPSRIAKMVEIIAKDPDSHRVIWHDLEAEREAIEQALPGVVTIMGSMDIDAREEKLRGFEEGETKHFATKPILSGSGSNFQYHCHKAIYVALPGYGYKFNDFLQSLFRLQRFGQKHLVEVDIIYAEDERAGRDALLEKWARDNEMRKRMSEIIKRHGLNTLPLRDALLRSIGVKRVEIKGEKFIAINNDAVAECRTWPDNSVDLMVSSIPFGTQYEYSASYHDFGHSDDSGHFWSQMDFLSSELLRMLKPGRLACIHVKDRILFGAVTGQGVPTVAPFHAEAIMHYRAHGFQYMGMITVVTDVVRENNQTYRLGWSENAKDGTKMGVGMPEYILLLRKPQSDRSKSYADVPVVKSKEDYTRARWQIDAHALWRCSGNRHLTPEEFAACSSADLAKLFAKTSVDCVYDFEAHVAIGEAVERTGTLPATFMAIAPGSHHPDVWHDVNRMRTLNMLQQRKGAEMHLCPLQFDIVDRLIERYSNPDDLVFDPFGGLMTVPYRALLKGRKGAATELSASYFLDGVHYLHMAEEKMTTPQLFDLATFDAVNTPPRRDDGG
jgi:hypothetical protein